MLIYNEIFATQVNVSDLKNKFNDLSLENNVRALDISAL